VRPDPDELAKVPLFASLARDELERVSRWLEVRNVDSGGVLVGGHRTATVTASTSSTLLVLFGTEFRQLEQELPEIAERIRTAMAERLGTGAAG
jgi:CRP-like cAMP-binding protein